MAVYMVERSLKGITMDQLGAAQKSNDGRKPAPRWGLRPFAARNLYTPARQSVLFRLLRSSS
jgi:hypothetical protein